MNSSTSSPYVATVGLEQNEHAAKSLRLDYPPNIASRMFAVVSLPPLSISKSYISVYPHLLQEAKIYRLC